MISLTSNRSVLMMVVSMLTFTMAACDDTLSPIIESDQQATMWGTLDMNADVQYIRVIPIRPVIDKRIVDSITLKLKSTDLNTGESVDWAGSEITFDDGSVGTVFKSDLKLEPEHTYRIELTSPDFKFVTSAETTVPTIPVAVVSEESVTVSVGPTGAVIRGSQQVVWSELSREPHEIEQWYRFLEFGSYGFLDFKLPYDVPSSYEEALGQLEMALDLKRQYDTLRAKLNLDQILLVGLGQTLTILDDELVPPGGVFDPEVLAQPGTMSNVENGFGFIGSVGRFSIEWVIADESAEKLTYHPLNGGVSANGPVGQKADISARPWEAE